MIPLLTPDELRRLRDQLPQRAAALVRELSWLDELDRFITPPAPPPPRELTLVAFNVERGTRFDGILALLAEHPALRGADIVLLNEVDWGMARSGNRHVARELAAALGLAGLFGIEFVELSKGFGAERDAPGENQRGLHGNAILSRYPLERPRLLRLPRCCEWTDGEQPRIGGRMALLAEVATAAGPLTLACTHLENRTPPSGRAVQMAALLEALPAGPAVIGGDLNTATIDGGAMEALLSIPDLLRADPRRLRRPEAHEPLIGAVRATGFTVDACNVPDAATAVPLGITDSAYWLKLDWIFVRGVAAESPCVVPALDGGERVSDHDALVVRLRC